MKIGVLSDSHDNLAKIEEAVKFFNNKKVKFVFHAGDFVAPFTIPKFKKLNCPWLGVLGNNDGEEKGLLRVSDGRIKRAPLRIKINQRRITLVHDISLITLEKEDADLIICGHTHKAKEQKKCSGLIINPGECGGWVTGESSVAIVDLDSLSSDIFKV